jgi:hypothetical protein
VLDFMFDHEGEAIQVVMGAWSGVVHLR